jgi:hypothetical protein
MNVRTNLVLPAELLQAIDEVAGPRGRSGYVKEVLSRHIERERWYGAMKASAGTWREHPLFPNEKSVVEWVEAGRTVTVDAGSERAGA